jgi:hypothetical protein
MKTAQRPVLDDPDFHVEFLGYLLDAVRHHQRQIRFADDPGFDYMMKGNCAATAHHPTTGFPLSPLRQVRGNLSRALPWQKER